MFKPSELTESALLEWVDKRHELANIPSDKTEDRAGWFNKGQRMNRELKQHKKEATEEPVPNAKVAAKKRRRIRTRRPRPRSLNLLLPCQEWVDYLPTIQVLTISLSARILFQRLDPDRMFVPLHIVCLVYSGVTAKYRKRLMTR